MIPGVLALLYVGAGFFKPLLFPAFLATLIKPVSAWLERKGMNRIFSSITGTLVAFILLEAVTLLADGMVLETRPAG